MNEDIIRITKTTRISSFTEKQYLKFITCTTRLEDNSLQTRTLIGVYWAVREIAKTVYIKSCDVIGRAKTKTSHIGREGLKTSELFAGKPYCNAAFSQ